MSPSPYLASDINFYSVFWLAAMSLSFSFNSPDYTWDMTDNSVKARQHGHHENKVGSCHLKKNSDDQPIDPWMILRKVNRTRELIWEQSNLMQIEYDIWSSNKLSFYENLWECWPIAACKNFTLSQHIDEHFTPLHFNYNIEVLISNIWKFPTLYRESWYPGASIPKGFHSTFKLDIFQDISSTQRNICKFVHMRIMGKHDKQEEDAARIYKHARLRFLINICMSYKLAYAHHVI